MKNLFIIKWGLGGGFGGASNYEVIQADDINIALEWANENAREEYEMYAGSNGLRDIDQIIEDDDCEEEDACLTYEEEMESWLDYGAEPWSRDAQEKAKMYHFSNPYSEVTDKIQ